LFAVPSSHSLFLQQPLQPGPHGGRQTRAWQTWPLAVQSTHAAPPVGPQAKSWVPVTQVFPEQQPFGQLPGPQACGWQAPLWQTLPGWFAQFWHSAPPPPQAVFWLPTAQMSPTQHPAHGVGALQSLPGTQLPAEQTSFTPHPRHASPLAPHACAVVATTHWVPTQQPAQVDGPHGWLRHVRAFGRPSPTHA
jgi:hypothetical protein